MAAQSRWLLVVKKAFLPVVTQHKQQMHSQGRGGGGRRGGHRGGGGGEGGNSSNGGGEHQKVVKTAVCLIPPVELWQPIQDIRKVHDKSYVRWPPHINLLYPFIPENQFEQAVPVIQRALADLPDFSVTLGNFGYFTHSKTSTLFLEPTTEFVYEQEDIAKSPLHSLQAKLQAAFPFCDDLSTISPAGFNPHLSVGQWDNNRNNPVEAARAEFQFGWIPLTFAGSSVYLISRKGFEDPFQVRYVVPIGQAVHDEAAAVKAAATAAKRIPTSTGELGCSIADEDEADDGPC